MSGTRATPLILIALAALLLSCAPRATPRAQASASATAAGPSGSPAGTVNLQDLWYLVRGGDKLDQSWAVTTDSGGNIYYATYQQAGGQLFTDIVVYKLRPDGTEIWHTHWGGPWQEKAFVIVVGGQYVYVGGCANSSAAFTDADMLVLALDVGNGSVAWHFSWGQGYGYEEVDGLVVEADAIYLTGWTTSKTTGNDVGLVKLNLDGNLIWARHWGGQGWDEADGQMVVDANTIYVSGRYGAANILLGGKGLLARFDKATGDYLSDDTWDGPLGTAALGMTSDGTYLYTVGITVDRGHGSQIQLRKYDKNLRLAWERLWGGNGREDARAVAIGPAGDIYIAGTSDSAADSGGTDALLLRYRPNGDLVWSRTWVAAKDEGIHGLAISGNLAYLAGNTKSFGSGQQDDAILIVANAETGRFPDMASRK